jgi:hypothetical protein
VDEQVRVAFFPPGPVPPEVDGVGVVGEGAEVEEQGVIGREGEGELGYVVSCVYVSQSVRVSASKAPTPSTQKTKPYP